MFTLLVVAAAGTALLLCGLTLQHWLASVRAERRRYAVELAWAVVPLALLAAIVAALTPLGNV